MEFECLITNQTVCVFDTGVIPLWRAKNKGVFGTFLYKVLDKSIQQECVIHISVNQSSFFRINKKLTI